MPEDTLDKAVGAALRAMRTSSGALQVDVANTLGVTQATVSRWENGAITPSATTYVQLAAFYGSANGNLTNAINTARSLLAEKE